VNNACALLDASLPKAKFPVTGRMMVAIALTQAGVPQDVIPAVRRALHADDEAMKNIRAVGTIPPTDWLRVADEVTPPDPGDQIESVERTRMLDAGWEEDDFTPASRSSRSGPVTRWVYQPDDEGDRPDTLPGY